jgi:hypothetical protein
MSPLNEMNPLMRELCIYYGQLWRQNCPLESDLELDDAEIAKAFLLLKSDWPDWSNPSRAVPYGRRPRWYSTRSGGYIRFGFVTEPLVTRR